MPTVLVTDYAWPSLDIERAVLATAGVSLLVAETGHEGELIQLAADADAILTCFRPVTAAVLDAAPRCRTVARYGVGLDNIDVQHADELGMVVTNVPAYCVDEVADHAAALVLALARNVVPFARDVTAGRWDNTAHRPMHRLRGRILGLVGYGAIARSLATRMRAFGMDVLAYSPSLKTAEDVAIAASLDELLARADIVSLHVPLTPATTRLIDARSLRLMKPGSYLVNTARGGVVDSAALVDALRSGHLAGAALDVLPTEPPDADDPLLSTPNLILTPHAAFNSVEAVEELQRTAATNVLDVLDGRRPSYPINPAVLDTAAYHRRSVGLETSP
jgi:D-3-phosphoglycerate dehydrogenase / 2-oxoglutarate reductase